MLRTNRAPHAGHTKIVNPGEEAFSPALSFLTPGNPVLPSDNKYKIVAIPKNGYGERVIYMPDEGYKNQLRAYLPELQSIAASLDFHNVSHGFIKGRNCVTNAMPHIGYQYSVSMDVESFFDSVTKEHVRDVVPGYILDECFIDGAARQGLPTSPLIANIALREVDKRIYHSLRRICGQFSYTRYADDLTVSFNNVAAVKRVIYLIRGELVKEGFLVNERKTRVQSSSNGRRVITGIGVGDLGVHASRKTLKALRAAVHQNNTGSARGLMEWAQCKMPGGEKNQIHDLYRYKTDGKKVACHFCLESGLEWEIENGSRYILVDKNGDVHKCPALPEAIDANDFSLELLDLGFSHVGLLSKTWKKGLWKASSKETMLILFRKNGVDLCIYDYAKSFPKDGRPVSVGEGGKIYRIGYMNEDFNNHAYLLRLVRQMMRGERIERERLLKFNRAWRL